MRTKTTLALAFALACAAAPAPALAAATVNIVNMDAAGEGFNDPTPVSPVGGNTGVTLGQQRLIAFQHAADIWGALLDSAAPISIGASFDPLTCTSTAAVLGSAGPVYVVRNFPNAPLLNTWYPGALANKLAGVDTDPTTNEIRARFNSTLGTASCLAGLPWYLGLDGDHGGNTDLVTVLLHEFAHGLGFVSFMSNTTGEHFAGFPDAYTSMAFDTSTGKNYLDMTPAERLASLQNGRRVIWEGPFVTASTASFLAPGLPQLTTTPPVVSEEILVGTASFGPALGETPLVAEVVLAPDAEGAPTDACSPLINLATGKIVLVDRGTCNFTVKAVNVQNAGGVGMIVADNTANNPPNGMGGVDPGVTIPSVQITQAVGTQLKASLALGPVTATLSLDASRLAGADASGRTLLFTPSPVLPSSNFSHWDTSATPNLLMEPFISSDLGHDVDLTRSLLGDLGWGCLSDQDCDDSAACTGDTCTDGTCANDVLADGTPCLDADACNGAETCSSGACTAGAPLACDDGHVCTAESCDPATGCASTPVAAGTDCGGGGTCDGAGACTGAKCLGVHLSSSTPLLPSGGAAGLIATGVSCGGDQQAEYRFLYRREGGPSTSTAFRPFSTDPGTAFLNAGLPSGKYTIEVRARTVGSTTPYESKASVSLLSGNVCTSVTLQALPATQVPGAIVNLTAVATCTEGEAEYEFSVRPKGGGAYTVLTPTWGPGTFAWNTTGASAGSYTLLVKARGAGNTTMFESQRSVPYTLADRCAQITASLFPKSTQTAGALVEVEGAATCQAGSTAELRYRFRPDGSTVWTDIEPWGAGGTVNWDTTGLAPGVYYVRIESRAPGVTAAQGFYRFTYTLTP